MIVMHTVGVCSRRWLRRHRRSHRFENVRFLLSLKSDATSTRIDAYHLGHRKVFGVKSRAANCSEPVHAYMVIAHMVPFCSLHLASLLGKHIYILNKSGWSFLGA